MVKIIKKIPGIVLLLALTFSGTAIAQQKHRNTNSLDQELAHAVNVLKGALPDESSEKALAVIEHAATKNSNAYAMNALGMAYMYGLGVSVDTAKVSYWLNQAGENGNIDSYHNLGLMYKNGIGVHQDFSKAYLSFMKGVSLGSIMCCYDAGFLLYKGFGCEQDYAKAAELFQNGADHDLSSSLYMLGLCYRNGYGVEQDTVRARSYLERAGKLGYVMALEELYRKRPENYLHELAPSVDSLARLPQSMPAVDVSINDTSMIAGSYEGALVMYDWSGDYILGEKPVKMKIENQGESFTGKLLIDGKPVNFQAELSADGRLVFKSGDLKMGERYLNSHSVRYRLDFAKLDVWNNSMSGQLGLYSLTLMEPERPMYIELQRKGTSTIDAGTEDMAQQRNNQISIAPNPFEERLTATFDLQDDANNVEARIFNKSSMLVDRISLGTLSKGRHSIPLTPSIGYGVYVLNITAGNHVLRTIIVKKEGAK